MAPRACAAVDVDEVEAVDEGCQAKVVAAVKSVGAEVSDRAPRVERFSTTTHPHSAHANRRSNDAWAQT